MHSEIFYEKKNEPYTGKHDNLNLCEKETYPLAKISASFQNPKRDLKKHALRCSCTYLYGGATTLSYWTFSGKRKISQILNITIRIT